MSNILEKTFVIKGYTKKQLGIFYFPELSPTAAWRKLRTILMTDDLLVNKLEMTSYKFMNRRWLDEKMVKVIVEHIGLP